jgi:hypothetical protein
MPEALAAVIAPTAISPSSPPAPSPPQPTAPPSAPARVTPGSKAWAEMTADQRHDQLRGPPNPRARGHSPAVEQRQAAAARAAGEPPKDQAVDQAAAAASTEKHKIGAHEISEKELGEMMTRQAAEDLRKATLPPTPDSYELKISPDAKLPGGVEFKFDGNDPGLIAAKNWAHARGLDQGAFSEMLTLYASHVAQQESAIAARSQQEIAKVGVNAGQRVDAIGKWLTGEVGAADAAPIRATLVTDAHVRFFERMMNKATTQGAASFSQQHRAAPETNSIPGYESMSFEQRREAQDRNAARRR